MGNIFTLGHPLNIHCSHPETGFYISLYTLGQTFTSTLYTPRQTFASALYAPRQTFTSTLIHLEQTFLPFFLTL